MEEILASIRRIIADDQKPAEPPAAGSRPVAVPDPEPDEDDVLDLAEIAPPPPKPEPKPEPKPATNPVAKAPPAPEPSFDDAFDPMSEIAFRDEPMDFDAIEIEPEPAPAPPPEPPKAAAPPPAAPPEPPRPAMEDRLLSQATDATVGHAFDLLASTVLTRNARTIEDLVQDMLRPMLKSWLDDNLPVLVERLVRAEIERVARGR
ncbi:hypothetical protein SQ03_22495 [Methylobacterium platani JCM 14648]|uniref:Pole-organizing protein PopZ n=3 Tax=Methylobacterium platani TaxID=427683 RepID=A0A179S0P0_9HYPH|nr:hypothetical protein SQ03_22495 [Methylobacterium platani JCM 14648]OAS18792.1 hypothetical protein A5481_25780 [Methylobacterium platani]